MRAAGRRVRFGSFHFGNEGNARRLFLHGPEATGEPVPYKLGDVVQVEVSVRGDQATPKINGKDVARSNPKLREERTITLEASDNRIAGTVEFSDLELIHD